MQSFERGERYTRLEIHAVVGGGTQDYLPHHEGNVVCACLNPSLNPGAPEIVLPGTGPGIEQWAQVFANQMQFVPTFLKRGTGQWEYVGDYRVQRRSVDTAEIKKQSAASGRDDLSMVLRLECQNATQRGNESQRDRRA